EHPQFSLIWGESENRVERGGLACAVGTDDSEDAALFDTQSIPSSAMVVPKALRRPRASMTVMASSPPLQLSKTGGLRQPPAALPVSGRAAEWLRRPWAIVPLETSGVRPAAAAGARPH